MCLCACVLACWLASLACLVASLLACLLASVRSCVRVALLPCYYLMSAVCMRARLHACWLLSWYVGLLRAGLRAWSFVCSLACLRALCACLFAFRVASIFRVLLFNCLLGLLLACSFAFMFALPCVCSNPMSRAAGRASHAAKKHACKFGTQQGKNASDASTKPTNQQPYKTT